MAQDNPAGERGLVGYFICGDLDMQFEFMLSTWVNLDYSTTGIRGTREPILGAQPEYGGQFVLRTSDERDPIVFDNLPRMVTTRGSVYCFLPGVAGLRFLAGAWRYCHDRIEPFDTRIQFSRRRARERGACLTTRDATRAAQFVHDPRWFLRMVR